MTIVDFLKLFERKKRLNLVDMLRGKTPLPINYSELKNIKDILNIDDEAFFELWKEIFTNYLEKGGFEKEKNCELLDELIKAAKKYFNSSKIDKCNIS